MIVFPTGKYQVIYADPPWSYNSKMAPGLRGRIYRKVVGKNE